MPDQSQDSTPLEEQVLLLKKALLREKNAKKQLEHKLETRINENYSKNSSFFEAYEKARSQQIQLQFLSTLTSDIFTLNNISDMIAKFLSNISIFLEPCEALIFKQFGEQKILFRLNKTDECLVECTQNLPITSSLLTQLDVQEHWQRLTVEQQKSLTDISSYLQYNTVLVYPLKLPKELTKYLILNINHYCYSDDFKQTLNTASKQFATAVEKQIAEAELAFNYSKLKSTVKELRATQQQLLHKEKMASLGQLSAGVAHEINNPLGYVLSNFDVLKEYCIEFEKAFCQLEQSTQLKEVTSNHLSLARNDAQEILTSCNKGLLRIADIVSNLKAFSRKDNDELEPYNINDIIESSLKIVWNQVKYHQIIKDLSSSLPLLQGNDGQLQQVFVNLFMNAIQAMENRGTLKIKTVFVGDYIAVTIADSGCGMSNDTIEKIFDPFFTTKESQEGTGLGLSVSYAILEKHQALVRVNSELGVGSTFTLMFPHI